MSKHDSDARKVTLVLQNADQAVDVSDELLPLVYDQLRRLAAKQMSHEIPGQTLQPTALVHEAYLQLRGLPAIKLDLLRLRRSELKITRSPKGILGSI